MFVDCFCCFSNVFLDTERETEYAKTLKRKNEKGKKFLTAMQVRTSSSVVTGNDLLKKVAETMKFMRNFVSHSRTFLLKIGSSHESITLHIHRSRLLFQNVTFFINTLHCTSTLHSMMIGKRIFFVLQKKKKKTSSIKKKKKKQEIPFICIKHKTKKNKSPFISFPKESE